MWQRLNSHTITLRCLKSLKNFKITAKNGCKKKNRKWVQCKLVQSQKTPFFPDICTKENFMIGNHLKKYICVVLIRSDLFRICIFKNIEFKSDYLFVICFQIVIFNCQKVMIFSVSNILIVFSLQDCVINQAFHHDVSKI